MRKVKEQSKPEEDFDSSFINQYLNITAPPRYIKSSKKKWIVGDLINERYKINQIKQGGMGIVYMCHDNVAGADIAIKTYIERFDHYRETIERFRSEAFTWIKLGKHPNIVQAKYVLNIDERPYIFMEYIRSNDEDSPSLRIQLEQERLDLDLSIDYAVQFCNGMIHATKLVPGLIHNDIKPENILITPDGTLKVSDFGLVKIYYDSCNIGVFKGSVPYSSPEQCLGLAMTDESSDIYSFGLVLYEMFTGEHPFKSIEKKREMIIQHLLTKPVEPSKINPNIPDGLNRIIMKCLEKKPEDRYHNFSELKVALSEFYEHSTDSVELMHSSPDFNIIEAQRYVNKGISMNTFGRYDEAISFFNLALKTNPGNIEALSRKGIALVGMGQIDEAFQCFNSYLKVNPCDVDVLNHKGSILNLQGRRWEAVECFNKALDHQSQCNEVLYNKAVTLFNMGRFDEADETLMKIEDKSIKKNCETLQEACLLRNDIPHYENKNEVTKQENNGTTGQKQ